jgi:YHS domain-containing protein
MKNLFLLSVALLGTTMFVTAQNAVNTDKSGLGLKGYDPVAYFTRAAAVKGDPQFTAAYEGVTYRFSSAGHKAVFESSPATYAPQFGGYCAWAVSQGYTAPIDPNAFQIVDGRLLLQYSLGIREKFGKDTAGNLAKADANWPKVAAEVKK